MIKAAHILCTLSLLITPFYNHAQDVDLTPDDFKVSGHTLLLGDQCYQMTSAIDWSAGGVWHKSPLSLNNSFEMDLDILFGCKNEDGADGVVFIFSPYSELTGRPGEGMGFSGLYPSLGIEIDTWQNFHLSDPVDDHVAILRDGVVDHFSNYNLAGPQSIQNVEDCTTHQLSIRWDPGQQKLLVLIDQTKVIEYIGDIKNEIFYGKDEVFWGVSAATGKYNNRHELCFQKLRVSPPLDQITFSPQLLDQLETSQMTSLDNLSFDSGSSNVSEQSIPELYKILNLLRQNPRMSLDIYGHTDNVGGEEANQKISFQRAQRVADFLIEHGIDQQRLNVQGLGEYYPRSTNKTPEGRKKNRRVDIKLYKPRT